MTASIRAEPQAANASHSSFSRMPGADAAATAGTTTGAAAASRWLQAIQAQSRPKAA